MNPVITSPDRLQADSGTGYMHWVVPNPAISLHKSGLRVFL